MKSVGILGGGFGLYGYLPAFLYSNYEVYTLEKYKRVILNRKDLKLLNPEINFLTTEDALLNSVDNLVVARDPISQMKIIEKVNKKYDRLFLEKPLASSIDVYNKYLKILNQKSQKFSIFYIFEYLDWYKNLKKVMHEECVEIDIIWKINFKNNKRDTWKFINEKGGGLNNYYAIHFFNLIDELDEYSINCSRDKNNLKISFLKDLLNSKINLKVSLTNTDNFTVMKNKTILFQHQNPFGEEISSDCEDPRIKYIKSYILKEPKNSFDRELKVLEWLKIID